MVPPQPLTSSASYETNWTMPRYLKPKVGAYVFTAEVTTLWRYTNLFIIIIILSFVRRS